MRTKKDTGSFRAAIVAGIALLAFASGLRADLPTLNISQPLFDVGNPSESWGWQSFTVTEDSTITTFAFEWNGSAGNLNATATVDLLTGEGTGGTLLKSVTGSVVYDTSGPYEGYNFFTADFGGVDLTPGQYTAYYHDATDLIWTVQEFGDPYSGGKFVNDWYGYDDNWDATFFTPAPIPEPAQVALMLMGLFGVGGYTVMNRRSRKGSC